MPISTITNGEAGSSVRAKLNTVIGAVNALGTAANNATGDFATAAQGALADTAVQPAGLGGAASLDVGTTAGTVAAGDDSRFSDARTPTAHASTHVTGGSDAIQSATSGQNGLMTSAYASKLDGIEAGADVTDAANVATAGALMTSALGTGVATALGVNVGSAGAPVVNGGALGTPSSGTLTSCTGLPTAGLVDDAVTLAKMAAGTAGNLITYDASGNPAAVTTGTAGQKLTSNGTGAAPTFQNEALRVPVFFSDQTTDWTTGTKVTFTWRFGATTLSSTPVDCTTAPTGSAAQFNVTKNGSTIYSTKPTIDAGETSTDTAATPAVLSTTSLANGDIVAIAIDQVGSTIKGKGGVITFIGTTLP